LAFGKVELMSRKPFKTIDWTDEGIVILNQRELPLRETYQVCQTADCVVEAIKKMIIRGAPAIGVAAAMGLALGAKRFDADTKEEFLDRFEQLCERFASSRPTAVNLFWAIERMKRVAETSPLSSMKEALEGEARRILEEDVAINRSIGEYGKELVPNEARILTHCNAGALATGGFGTALGVVYAAVEEGKKIHVYADETRPVLQGARLTAWELHQHGVPVTLITDNMAAMLMKEKKIDLVIVGADRIARNGDTANKIGTYGVAVLADCHGIPFYVAAPLSTFDLALGSGEEIPIEYRDPAEVFCCGGRRVSPEGIEGYNPAFDVTPARFIHAIITERGVLHPPYEDSIREIFLD